MNIKIFLIIVLWSLFLLTNQRIFKEEYAFPMLRRNKGWTFLDRIKLGQGSSQVRFNVKILLKEGQTNKTYGVQLSVVPDSLWTKQQLIKCSIQDSSQSGTPIQPTDDSVKQRLFTGTLGPDNNYQFGMLEVMKIPRTETYHFILKDCDKQITSDYFSRQSRLVVELQVKNNGKDYGEDEGSNFYWFPALILGTLAMLRQVHNSFVSRAFDTENTDYVKYLVCSCLWMNLISLVFKYIGYLIYFYFGKDYGFFDFVYLFFHSVGDSVIISIFIFVSYGWTITFTKGNDFDLYVPLVSMMGLITVILTLLNKITDGAHDKYHMYDTIPSYLLVFFKLLTIIIFIAGCIKTILQSKKEPRIQYFMYQILLLGGLYISSVPLVMLIVEYIPASARKQWVFILIQLAKTFIAFLLTYMISYKKSGYRSISLGDKSFMQSGNKIL